MQEFNYEKNKEFNFDKLTTSIKALNIDLAYITSDNDFINIFTNTNLSENEINILNQAITDHTAIEPKLRIYDLVDDAFMSYLPYKIDFRKMLKPDIHIQKDVIMHENGRPDYAIYTYNNENIAKIRFEFELNSLQLMTRRKEILIYFMFLIAFHEIYVFL